MRMLFTDTAPNCIFRVNSTHIDLPPPSIISTHREALYCQDYCCTAEIFTDLTENKFSPIQNFTFGVSSMATPPVNPQDISTDFTTKRGD